MDLAAGERLLKDLETEAARVRGLGDLREEIQKSIDRIDRAAVDLRNSSQELVEIHEAARRSLEELLRLIPSRLDEHKGILNSGIIELLRLVQSLVGQIDSVVKAELVRASAEIRKDVGSAVGVLGRQIDVSARETNHHIKTSASAIDSAVVGAVGGLGQQIRSSLYALGGMVVLSTIIISWLISRSH